jgi:hypothetical protein
MPCSVGVVSSESILRVDWDDRRGMSFMQQYTYRQLGLAEAADQLAGVMYLKSLPYIDRDRVGYDALISQQPSVVGLFSVSALNCFVCVVAGRIWGWSYGGYMTTKVMATAALKPNPSGSCDYCLKAAVAVAPVSDWRFYGEYFAAMEIPGSLCASVRLPLVAVIRVQIPCTLNDTWALHKTTLTATTSALFSPSWHP